MLQTAKLFARRGSDASNCYKHMNGLTFGEFCVLAADLKRFRTQNTLQRNQSSDDDGCGSSCSSSISISSSSSTSTSITSVQQLWEQQHHQQQRITIDELTVDAQQSTRTEQDAPEVFLGGSCNPTTWRADVAIPTLDKLGISFYNPVCVVINLRSRNYAELRLYHLLILCWIFLMICDSAASVKLDARSHRTGASGKGEGTCIVLRHGLGDERIGRCHRSSLHCRPEFSATGARHASIQTGSVHFR